VPEVADGAAVAHQTRISPFFTVRPEVRHTRPLLGARRSDRPPRTDQGDPVEDTMGAILSSPTRLAAEIAMGDKVIMC
jgi:hypothetical protein